MSTLYVKDVPDDTKTIVAQLAADEGTNLSEFVRRLLEDVARRERKRRDMKAAREELDALQARMTRRPSQTESADAVRAVRDEYERGNFS